MIEMLQILELMTYKKILPGFIALYSVLVISGLLLLLVVSASNAVFIAHEAVIDEYAYRMAQQAAFSCAHLAFERLDADSTRFIGIGTTTIQLSGSLFCGITAASSTENTASVLTYGSSTESFVLLFTTATRASSSTQLQIKTWIEK